MNSDEIAELARLREVAYGPAARIDAESLERLRELERRTGPASDAGTGTATVERLANPEVDATEAPSSPEERPRRRVSVIAAVAIGLAIALPAGFAGFAIGSESGRVAAADQSPSPSATDSLVPGSPSADVQCGQLDVLIGVLATARFELDLGVTDEQYYAAQVRGVENVLRQLPLGYTDVSSEMLLVQRAAARVLDPSDEAFRRATSDAAQACADAGANLTFARPD